MDLDTDAVIRKLIERAKPEERAEIHGMSRTQREGLARRYNESHFDD